MAYLIVLEINAMIDCAFVPAIILAATSVKEPIAKSVWRVVVMTKKVFNSLTVVIVTTFIVRNVQISQQSADSANDQAARLVTERFQVVIVVKRCATIVYPRTGIQSMDDAVQIAFRRVRKTFYANMK